MSRSNALAEDHYVITWEVEDEFHGLRLDAFLKRFNKRRSREKIQKLIEEGRIEIVREQGAHLQLGKLKPSSQIFAGDVIRMRTERRPEPEVDFNYKILFEDETILAIDKPGNLPVHPAGKYYYHSLIVHLKTGGFLDALRTEREYFLVHRIDRETSGILILAKDREVCEGLTAQFRERIAEKRYYALVHGRMKEERIQVDLPLGKPADCLVSLKMAHVPQESGGLQASTLVHRRLVAGDFTWVECFPKTGRQHQIRAHLDAIGHPLVGDKLYGISELDAAKLLDEAGKMRPEPSPALEGILPRRANYERFISPELEAKLLLPRHALHSAGLKITHPLTGKLMEFTSELPEDLQAFLERQSDYDPKRIAPTDWHTSRTTL